MNITHKDFIGIYGQSMTAQECESVIKNFEQVYSLNPSSIDNNKRQFSEQELSRQDYAIFANLHMLESARLINEKLNTCLNRYSEEFFVIKSVKAHSVTVKIQRTPPRGGYHVWHPEVTGRENMERVLTWMIYLNDIPSGEGETEFLWQGLRVQPKAGTCVIWPAQFTHTHRGNPVYSCDKYIATGWYTYID